MRSGSMTTLMVRKLDVVTTDSPSARGSCESPRVEPQSLTRVVVLPVAVFEARPRHDHGGWRGKLYAWRQRWLGPPEIELERVAPRFGAFRALSEIGSDYLPSSGTWPSSGTGQ